MSRIAAGLCLAIAAALVADPAAACGDKLLVLRRSPRSQRAHGAVQRARILIIHDGRGQLRDALRDTRLERDLELAGHRLRVVSPSIVAEEIRAGDYDIVMAELAQAVAMRSSLPPAPRGPTLVPVVVNATGDEWPQAEAAFACVSRAATLGTHYLAVIEKVMRQRRAQDRARERE